MIVCLHKNRSGSYCDKRAIVCVPDIRVPLAGHEVALQLCWRYARCAYVRRLRHEPIVHTKET